MYGWPDNKELFCLKIQKTFLKNVHKILNSGSYCLAPVLDTLKVIHAKENKNKSSKWVCCCCFPSPFIPSCFCWKRCISWSCWCVLGLHAQILSPFSNLIPKTGVNFFLLWTVSAVQDEVVSWITCADPMESCSYQD